MDDLRKLIQEKKESKDYYTVREGLITEVQCFEAIEALGNRKTILKKEIERMLKDNVDPNDQRLQALVITSQTIHKMQSDVVNDVCARFEVIHPDFMTPSEELKQIKRPYWDWYKEMYLKYYGRPAPDVL